jgi:hypothetical protein
MRKTFLLVCTVLVAGLATSQVMGNFNYSNDQSRWGLTPGGVVMSPPSPYPALMVTPGVVLDNGMPRPATSVPVLVMLGPATAPSADTVSAGAPRFVSLGVATFKTAYDLAGDHQDLAQVAAELKQNRPHATRTYTNNDIAALKPPKPLSH